MPSQEDTHRIYGELLIRALDLDAGRSGIKPPRKKQLEPICPQKHPDLLGQNIVLPINQIELDAQIRANGSLWAPAPFPFVDGDNVFRTIHDLRRDDSLEPSEVLEFASVRVSRSALYSAICWTRALEGTTIRCEASGKQARRKSDPEIFVKFSEEVCKWGGDNAYYGIAKKMKSGNADLGNELMRWLNGALDSESAANAIRPGVRIKGLGISFASKHLRMLAPDRFATLDSVLSAHCGFALNQAGYRLFMKLLADFRREHNIPFSLGAIEHGLFYLVRPLVRQTPHAETD